MYKNGNDSFYKRGRIILAVAVFCLLAVTVLLQQMQNKGSYRLQVTDRSGETKEETEPELLSAENFSTIRVLLYGTDYLSMYHDRICVQGSREEVALDAETLLSDMEGCRTLCADNGILLEKEGEDGTYYTMEMTDGSQIEILSIVRNGASPKYRGRLFLYPENEGLVIVNELPLEEYLYGVLPSEMPASYEEEALKAQAVCARTFACRYLLQEKYPAYHAALDDSTSCQVYLNLPEQERTSAAVDQTKGIVLLYEGAPASTFYYSTSCGISADAGTWPEYDPEEYPYLGAYEIAPEQKEVDFSTENGEAQFRQYLETNAADAYESSLPWYRWNCMVEAIDFDLLYEKMLARYQVKPELIQTYRDGNRVEEAPVRLSEITEISVVERNAGGSVSVLKLGSTDRDYLIYGEYNIRYILCDGKTSVVKQDGSEQIMSTILPSGFFVLEPLLYKEQIIGYSMFGGGYGHGVGLSQNGANCMAEQGMQYEEILSYFYKGTELTQW